MTFADIVTRLISFTEEAIIPLIFILALVAFFFGMMRYFFLGGEENRQKAPLFFVYAILALVLMFSIWGLLRLLLNSLGVS